MTSGIYIIRNLITDMIYIGSSVNIERRWREHKRSLSRGTHRNRHLQGAWNEYDADNFEFRVVEVCGRDVVTEREQHWLDTYLPTGKCYNININAEHPRLGLKTSIETRQRLSKAGKGRKLTPEHRQRLSEVGMGHAVTPETRQKIGKKNKGRKHTSETRQRISESGLGHIVTPETRRRIGEKSKGRKHSPETRQRMSEVQRGRKHSPETRQRMSETRKGKGFSIEHRQHLSVSATTRSQTPEFRQRMSKIHKGKTMSAESRQQISKAALNRSRCYEIIHPSGDVSIVQGLAPFCREHNLDRSAMYRVISGKYSHHRGFRCRALTDEETLNCKLCG